MQISKNRPNYDSIISNNTSIQHSKPLNTVKKFLEAFRVDLSARALSSREIDDPEINFPTHNPDVLQYSNNLNLILKP